MVDIFDAKSKALLFRGTAEDEISDKAEKNIKKVEKAKIGLIQFQVTPPKTDMDNQVIKAFKTVLLTM